MELYVTRNRDSNLQLFTSDRIIKNNGQGRWLPEYEVQKQTKVIQLDRDMFPEIEWSDDKPTKVKLVNPSKQDDTEDIDVSGIIELNAKSDLEQYYNVPLKSPVSVFINDISYIEHYDESDMYHSIVHMKNGDNILCVETRNQIKRLIANHNEHRR